MFGSQYQKVPLWNSFDDVKFDMSLYVFDEMTYKNVLKM